MSRRFHVRVSPLPLWLDRQRFLGAGEWTTSAVDSDHLEAESTLDRDAAAGLVARLRGVGIGGSLITVDVSPSLNRKELRRANLEEARRYRQGSTGFSHRLARLDTEGRVSLTPEALALALGERATGLHVIDACAGAGGNAIGFARAGCEVTAVEINPSRLAMAKHNAKLYGVADQIEFLVGDARSIVPDRSADLLFIDPPWGERYDKKRVVLSDLSPCPSILSCSGHIPKRWIKAPPSFDPSTLPDPSVEAFFGVGPGDRQRVKFLLLEI